MEHTYSIEHLAVLLRKGRVIRSRDVLRICSAYATNPTYVSLSRAVTNLLRSPSRGLALGSRLAELGMSICTAYPGSLK